MTAVSCPGCRDAMSALVLDRVPLGDLTVDLCPRCHALWFDAMESLQLSPKGTLELFRAIHAAGAVTATFPTPPGARLPCPRCDTPLELTQDLQRATRFTYFRCRHGHGRFTPFVQFLREKNFIKPVSAAELERLRALVRVVRCSSCGAPVDLASDTACRYCRAPVAVLDVEAVSRALRELDDAAARRSAAESPQSAAAVVLESARFQSAMQREDRADEAGTGVDLVRIGLALVEQLVWR